MSLRERYARTAFLFLAMCYVLATAMSLPVRAQQVPVYAVDVSWPKLPLPNKWTFGGVTGLTVDSEGVIWVAQRPEVDDTENYATFDPPRARCCVPSKSIMAFDAQGNLLHAWSDPAVTGEQHMLLVDRKGQVWVGSDTFRIYTKEGQLLRTMPRTPRPEGGRGGRLRSQDTRLPASTELIVGAIEGAAFDEMARDVYLTDSYLGGRILVFDMDTLQFKRGWGAYGKPLGEISLEPRPPLTDPNKTVNAPNKDFVSHITIALSSDGIVYAADRRANRIQTFTKQGKFLNEYFIAPETLDRGSAGGMAFSADPAQRFLLVSDIMNNVVWQLNRADMKVVGSFGYAGRNAGGFHWLHMIATDSKGNVYTGEVDTGRRIQKFTPQPSR
jgi:sugar lactone lactonase YvrE